MNDQRFDRNIRFFGKEGQARLRAAKVAIVGVGGLGTHVAQQLAHLGVGAFTLIDDEELDETNLNRYIGARYDDPIPGTRKVDLGERLILSIDPAIQVTKIFDPLLSQPAFAAIPGVDCVFGCLDNEGARLVLTELCSAYARPYFDLATEIPPADPLEFGGQVVASIDGNGCLMCLGLLDIAEAQRDLSSPETRQDRQAIYGIDPALLDKAGPSVVSLNGVVASLAVTEFLVWITAIRAPARQLNYRGRRGIVTTNTDAPQQDCYYCKGIWGQAERANVQRYLP
jgi:molybdopterin/thiamine biosynthesis adenylyltransferase